MPTLPTRNIIALVSHDNQQMIKWFEEVTGITTTGIPDGNFGDITVSGIGTLWSVNAKAITLGKMADLAAGTIIGNNTGAAATPLALTPTQVRALLALVAIATTGSASDLTAGTLPAARFNDTSHGSRGGGPLHPDATTSVSGFMSGTDKTRLDATSRGRNGYVQMAPAAGLFVGNSDSVAALGSQVQVADRNIIAPFVPAYDLTIDQMGVDVSAGVGASNAKGVIYAADANGRPATILRESAAMSCASVGTVFASITAITLTAGVTYWVGVRASDVFTLSTIAALPALAYSGVTPQQVLVVSEAFGSPAASWTYASGQHSSSLMPLVLMRVA
jgi:predicted RecA/RadA family phage recombinase